MAGYTGHRKVPKRTVIVGDIEKGKRLIGAADSQLRVLEQSMTFQGLKQGSRTRRLRDGSVIECWAGYNLEEVRITVPYTGRKVPEKPELAECTCLPCFALGVVTAVNSFIDELHVFDEVLQEYGNKYLHDVDVCSGEGATATLVKFENFDIRAAGWERYYVGQHVLVSAGCEAECIMAFGNTCITQTYNAQCVSGKENYGDCHFVVMPLYLISRMAKKYKVENG